MFESGAKSLPDTFSYFFFGPIFTFSSYLEKMGCAAFSHLWNIQSKANNILRLHFPQGFLKDSLFIIQPAVPVLGYTRNVESCMGKSVRLWKGLRLWKFYGACLLMHIPYFRVSGSPCSGWGCDVGYVGTFCYCWADQQGHGAGEVPERKSQEVINYSDTHWCWYS